MINKSLILISLFILIGEMNSMALTIILKEHAVIDENIVSLSAIADFKNIHKETDGQLKDLIIGDTPGQGLISFFSKYDILRALRKNKIDTAKIRFSGATKTSVRRPGLYITEANIEEKALNYLKQTFANPQQVFIEMKTRIGEILLSLDPVEYQFIPVPGNSNSGNMFLQLNLIQKKQIVKSLKLQFQIQIFERVWTTKETISRNQLITKDDLLLTRREITKCMNSCLSGDSSKIVGKLALRDIPQGTVLEESMFKEPILIKRGDIITAMIDLGGLKVSVPVKALENGSMGEKIRAKNVDTGNIITGHVENPQMISVR